MSVAIGAATSIALAGAVIVATNTVANDVRAAIEGGAGVDAASVMVSATDTVTIVTVGTAVTVSAAADSSGFSLGGSLSAVDRPQRRHRQRRSA